MPRFYLLRHGEIDWPETDCFIGQVDPPLSAIGRRQAHAWNKQLGDTPLDGIWSSDLQRATETTATVFAGRAAEVRISSDLREIKLGAWDGMPRRWVKTEQPDLWRARGRNLAGFRPPQGESFLDLQERTVRRVEQIAADAGGAVCMVTHAGVIRVLICRWLQMPLANLFRIRLNYGSLSIVDYTPERIEVCALNLMPPGFGNLLQR